MSGPVFDVDFTKPAALNEALNQYLAMGVCPVAGHPFPGPMVDVALRLKLPDQSVAAAFGRVIQQLGANLFLVQLASPLNLDRLQNLVGEAPPASESTPAPEATAEEVEPEDEDGSPSGYESDHSAVYATVPNLPVEEKRRLARNGNKVMRQLLIKDPNKSLHVMVAQNPRVTLDEALEYSKRPNISADALKTLAKNRTFQNSNQFIFNLVRNPSTPIDIATRLLPKLHHNQLRIIAKSSSVRMPVNAAARKLVLQKLGN